MTHWILLRGLTREARHWGDFPEQLAAVPGVSGVRTLDLPGNGRRWREKSPAGISSIVEDCRARLGPTENRQPPHCLLAMSLGAMVATEWLFRHPEEIETAVLINTSMRPLGWPHERLRPRNAPALLGLLRNWHDAGAAERRILSMTSKKELGSAELVDHWGKLRYECPVSRMNALRQLLAAARYRLPPGAAPVPVLLLSSAQDGLVDSRCSARLAARWGCRHEVHAEAGHDLPLDDPRWVLARIREWLDCLARRQGAVQRP